MRTPAALAFRKLHIGFSRGFGGDFLAKWGIDFAMWDIFRNFVT